MRKLNARESTFCREYVLDHNGTRAAVRAGYAEKNAAAQASKMLKKEAVREKIQEHEKEIAAAFGLTAESILNRYAEIYERCMAAKEVLIWDREKKEYVSSGLWTFDAKGAIKALNSIAIMAGIEGKKRGDDGESAYESLLREVEQEEHGKDG